MYLHSAASKLPYLGITYKQLRITTTNEESEKALRKIYVLILVLLCIGLGMSSNAYSETPYDFTSLDFPEALDTEGRGINNLGHIVGDYTSKDEKILGFIYDGTAFQSVEYANSSETTLIDINDAGLILGRYTTIDWEEKYFLYNDGSFDPLPDYQSMSTIYRGLNNSGQIVGSYGDDSSGFHGLIYDRNSGTFTVFDYTGAYTTIPFGISNSGAVVGIYATSLENYFDGITPTFVYENGEMSVVPHDTEHQPNDINNSGYIALGGYVHSGTSATLITGLPEGGEFEGYSINDSGEIVGVYTDSSYAAHVGLVKPKLEIVPVHATLSPTQGFTVLLEISAATNEINAPVLHYRFAEDEEYKGVTMVNKNGGNVWEGGVSLQDIVGEEIVYYISVEGKDGSSAETGIQTTSSKAVPTLSQWGILLLILLFLPNAAASLGKG